MFKKDLLERHALEQKTQRKTRDLTPEECTKIANLVRSVEIRRDTKKKHMLIHVDLLECVLRGKLVVEPHGKMFVWVLFGAARALRSRKMPLMPGRCVVMKVNDEVYAHLVEGTKSLGELVLKSDAKLRFWVLTRRITGKCCYYASTMKGRGITLAPNWETATKLEEIDVVPMQGQKFKEVFTTSSPHICLRNGVRTDSALTIYTRPPKTMEEIVAEARKKEELAEKNSKVLSS